MYRTPVTALPATGARVSADRSGREALALRFATIRVNQFRGSPWRKPNIRPVRHRVARLEGRSNHPGGDELVEAARSAARRVRAGGNELGHDPAVRGNGDTLPRLDPSYEAAQVVFEVTNTGGGHERKYSYMWRSLRATFPRATSWSGIR